MKNRFLISAIISFLFPFTVYSQTPPFYHYTSANGLASSTVFEIIQDRNGFIWIATLNGLSKFDGKHFISYRTNEGLNSNSITSLAEGNKSELYIGNYEKGINVLKNGRIENYCSEVEGKSIAISYLLLTTTEKEMQKMYAYRSWGAISSISESKSAGLITNFLKTNPIYINKIVQLPDGELLALTLNGLYNLVDDKLVKLKIPGLPDNEFFSYAKDTDDGYLVGTKGMIYKIKNNNIVNQYRVNLFADNNDVIAILKDKNSNIWFSILNKGYFMISANSEDIIDMGSKMDLQNTLVNNYLEDNEGNIWISTYGKGVYCLNNLYIKNYSETDGLSSNSVYSIVKDKSGKYLFGTFNGLDVLEGDTFHYIKNDSQKTLASYIHGIKNINNEFYVGCAFGGNEVKNISYRGLKLHIFDQPSFCKAAYKLYLFGTWGNSIRFQRSLKYDKNNTYTVYLFGENNNVNRVNEIFKDSYNNIWVGSNFGLCRLSYIPGKTGQEAWKKSFFLSHPILNSKIVAIIQDKENRIWFAGEKGISNFNLKNGSITDYTYFMNNDLSGSTSIVTDGKDRVWIGNMKGLYLFNGKTIQLLNRQTGLPSDEVYSLFYDSDKNFLYIGTSGGISVLNINSYDSFVPAPLNVKITSIRAGDSVYTNYNNLIFKPVQNNVYIDLNATCFASPGSVKYKYNLNGQWKEAEHDFLDFVALENGKYDLQIIAKSQNSDWSKPYFVSFRVLPRFVETIWFNLLIIAILVSLSVLVITRRFMLKNKKIKDELELTEKINELKHQALSAMMNPHFIFNSLNSVQYLINSGRNEEANDYIAVMAKLIRKNLDTAGHGFILLTEEINRLNLYLNLEKLRFQDDFSFEIITGPDIDPNSIMIPNMIIQPFVENTLWHGIINSGTKGMVTISFLFEDVNFDSIICKSLIIKVTDNGIGINEAKKNKNDDHISKGIQIIEERLKLLSAKMLLPKPIILEDLSSRDNHSHGTEVIVSLPPELYKIIIPDSGTPFTLTD